MQIKIKNRRRRHVGAVCGKSSIFHIRSGHTLRVPSCLCVGNAVDADRFFHIVGNLWLSTVWEILDTGRNVHNLSTFGATLRVRSHSWCRIPGRVPAAQPHAAVRRDKLSRPDQSPIRPIGSRLAGADGRDVGYIFCPAQAGQGVGVVRPVDKRGKKLRKPIQHKSF